MHTKPTDYRLTLRFALISFFAVGLTAAAIILFFRYQTVMVIEESTRRSSEVLTVATEYALNDHFVMFLNFVEQDSKITNKNVALGPMLTKALQKLLQNTSVVRMKIYNTAGTVVYSTKENQIGEGQEENAGFKNALKGKASTVLIYRDSFNVFDREQEDENLVQTYVPIRQVTTGEVKGVFEVYSDINEYIHISDRTIWLISAIVIVSMFALYAFLLMHINRSENIINAQNSKTRERNRMLEYLTAKMINAQEDERRRIAYELHEDVVQTISGVKMQLEKFIGNITDDEKGLADDDMTSSIVPILQEAAQKIRLVAMDLRPPSLDDFGLRAAVNSSIAECHASVKDIEVVFDCHVAESDLSMERKSILYRMIKDTLKSLCYEEAFRGLARFDLRMESDELLLMIHITSDVEGSGLSSKPGCLESVQERTILSGGSFEVLNENNGIESVSRWHI